MIKNKLIDKILRLQFDFENKKILFFDEISLIKDPNYDTEIKNQNIYINGYKRAVKDIFNKLKIELRKLNNNDKK